MILMLFTVFTLLSKGCSWQVKTGAMGRRGKGTATPALGKCPVQSLRVCSRALALASCILLEKSVSSSDFCLWKEHLLMEEA